MAIIASTAGDGPADCCLLKDLKQRGLLDSTLVHLGGEFGRTPMSESGTGRDHNPYGFTMWMRVAASNRERSTARPMKSAYTGREQGPHARYSCHDPGAARHRS